MSVVNLIIKKYNALKKSSTMLAIKIVIFLHILFSHYIQMSSSKITSFLLRCYCLCATVLPIYLFVYYIDCLLIIDPKGAAVAGIVLLEFFLGSLVSQITRNSYLVTYIRTVFSLDFYIRHPIKVFGCTVFSCMLLSLCIGVSSLLFDMFLSKFWAKMLDRNKFNILYLLSNHYMMMSIDMMSFKVVLAVGFLHNRLVWLRNTLENYKVPEIIVGNTEILLKLRAVRKCLQGYRILLDAFECIYGHLQFAMYLLITFDVLRFTLFGYCILKQVIYHKYTSRILFVDGIRFGTRMFAPCIITELCYNEVNKLKVLLVKQITESSDVALRAELLRGLEYVSRRPFSFTLLRKMRVDIRLPITILALAITYIILLIEFTHFVL